MRRRAARIRARGSTRRRRRASGWCWRRRCWRRSTPAGNPPATGPSRTLSVRSLALPLRLPLRQALALIPWVLLGPVGGCPYWGLCRWNTTGENATTIGQLRCRSAHYSYGLLSKFLRGPAQVHAVQTGAGNDTIASFVMADDGASTLVVLNAGDTASAPLTVQLPQGTLTNSARPDHPA